jgi:hypothetical protein
VYPEAVSFIEKAITGFAGAAGVVEGLVRRYRTPRLSLASWVYRQSSVVAMARCICIRVLGCA